MNTKARWIALTLLPAIYAGFGILALTTHPLPANAAASSRPSKGQIVDELNKIVPLDSFDASHPISQQALCKWLLDLGSFCALPGDRDAPARPNCDDSIGKASAKLFVRRLVGQDLASWPSPRSATPLQVTEDYVGWTGDSANSVWFHLPTVELTAKPREAAGQLLVSFRVVNAWNKGVLSSTGGSVLETVATGSAVIEYREGNWTVTSWHVMRNRKWKHVTLRA
ncbi:MAG: hypothetical protein P4L33_00655 [Capsulimonadaceae bacterium]|nr:hypothetical protein [Capsulimonadaceae bacterium]